MSVNVTEYESTLWHDGLRIRILPVQRKQLHVFGCRIIYKCLRSEVKRAYGMYLVLKTKY